MKSALLLALVCVISAVVTAQPQSRLQPPFVGVGVSYPAELTRDRERTASDFEEIYTLGFNSIRLSLSWADAEPARGQYRFDALDRAMDLAGRAGLGVILRLDTASPPGWLFERYPDGRHVPAEPAGRRPLPSACLDHPGVRRDVEAYLSAVSAHAGKHVAWQAVEVGSDLDAGFCLCPHTARRFREWTNATSGSAGRSAEQRTTDRAAFIAFERRDHLAWLAGAMWQGPRLLTSVSRLPSILQSPRAGAGQDDWLMARVVGRYGTLLPPDTNGPVVLLASRAAFGLDGLRGAAGDNGWVADLAGETPAADLRLWTWTAVARGARAAIYGDWRTAATKADVALVGPDDAVSDRAKVAGGLARVIGRNPALFAPLRTRHARVSFVYDSRTDAASVDWLRVYKVFFDRNIQVDVLNISELPAGAVDGYLLAVSAPLAGLPPLAAAAIKAYTAGGGKVLTVSARGPTIAEIVRTATGAGVVPDVRIGGATGAVETRFLESADVLMLIGLNHTDARQRVTMTFPPDTQEAIWQNMETGAAVNFVAGPEGPTYTYTFNPRDALVLMIRKNIR